MNGFLTVEEMLCQEGWLRDVGGDLIGNRLTFPSSCHAVLGAVAQHSAVVPWLEPQPNLDGSVEVRASHY